MKNVFTNKYLKALAGVVISSLPGRAATSVAAYLDFVANYENCINLTFIQGDVSAPLAGERITFSGGATALVKSVNLTGGAWDGTATGDIDLYEVDDVVVTSENGTSASGGYLGFCLAMSVPLRDTSRNDCSVAAGAEIAAFLDGKFVLDTGYNTFDNIIPIAEVDVFGHRDMMVVFTGATTTTTWGMSIGNPTGDGAITVNAVTDSVSLKLSGETAVQLNLPAGSIPHDGLYHTFAVILKNRRVFTPVLSLEIDGVEIDSMSIPVANFDLSAASRLSITASAIKGLMYCYFESDLPANYQDIVTDFATKHSSDEIGIPLSLTGTR